MGGLKASALALLCAAAFCTVSLPASAQKLYKDLLFDAPKDELAAAQGYRSCGADLLCKDDEVFVGQTGTLVLEFKNDKLKTVSVKMPPFPDAMHTMIVPVASSGNWAFSMMINRSTGQTFDVHAAVGSASDAEAKAQIMRFANEALGDRAVLFAFMELTPATKGMLVSSFEDFFEKAPTDTRMLRMEFVDSTNSYWIEFSLPKLAEESPATDIGGMGKF